MRTLLTALFIVFATQVSAECGEMCGYEFWKKGATIADVKRAIDNGEDVNQRNSAGNGPLLWAGYYSDLDTFKFLVEQGADIHARNLNGSTALVGSKRPEIVEYLLNLGADVNPKLNDEMTIFIFQAGNDCQVESLKLLDKAGTNTVARDKFGRSALHWAAMWSAPSECLDYLVEIGAKVNLRTLQGDTPLHSAAKCIIYCEAHVIPWLLNKGADPHAKNGKGKTPWDLAQNNKDVKGSEAFWALNDAYYK